MLDKSAVNAIYCILKEGATAEVKIEHGKLTIVKKQENRKLTYQKPVIED